MNFVFPNPDFVAPGWTDERVERLKTLWAAGLSCSKIASALGHVTRNAVIGKVTRLGLDLRGKGGNYNGNQRSNPGPKSRPRVAKPAAITLRQPKVSHESPEIKAMRCDEITPLNVSLLDLAHGQCRYPYGETGVGDGVLFCGHPAVKDRSYCASHFTLTIKPGWRA